MSEKPKKIGLVALTALIISSSIGSGIFAIPTDMASAAAPGAALIAWLIAGLGVLALCLSIVNIGRKKPELSGIVSYAEDGFGPFSGFISGWGYWLSAWLGNVAFATMMMKTLGRFFPIFGEGNNIVSITVASVILWCMYYIVNRGVEGAASLNTIITLCKLVPLALYIVLAILFFDFDTFMNNFWGTASGGFEFGKIMEQVQNSMMVIMWVFVGVEGAAMMSDRAQSKSIIGKSTVLGLLGLLVIYVSASILPYGIMTQEQVAALHSPAMGYVLVDKVGNWFPVLVNIALIISIFGSWLSWTMLPAETTLVMANRHLLPQKFGELNAAGAPTFSLVFMTGLTQIFMFTLLFTNQAYQFAYSLCTAAIFVSWLYVTLYQTKLSFKLGELPQTLVGLVGSIFYLWAIWASGIDYFLLCLIVYLLGIILYRQARKEKGITETFSAKEKVLLVLIVAGAVIALFRLFTGQISI
ncbi:arginine-ornithine antiporter [Streptococcus ratti]|uniref:Arginine-ornithine antiporter n=2 Tax=Streptococcus ratti TaxID=1341 RepID=Q6TK71_STRRT|nr:arginine-ornithine antiporter [Streptococcus ratti]VEI60953.1 putative arginine-ornithine antiporter [Streptococcus mutans]AAR30325.1 arginine-ornithine antiporter [Streptococcus ratti FA-1 = DSM 20564]EJN94685.1 arginine/ornithine antiporter [Streptococcus ratti FA-1 = DSM 20564]EMP70213.1 putative arginine-ornithine antiporter [Streptococcus ratti FA-1 = DSM 20564]NMD48482.1 arginine-ornithine antiporter [Streptococcus ratti]